MSVAGRLLFAAAERWRGSHVLALYREIAANPYRSPEDCQADQFHRLAALLEE